MRDAWVLTKNFPAGASVSRAGQAKMRRAAEVVLHSLLSGRRGASAATHCRLLKRGMTIASWPECVKTRFLGMGAATWPESACGGIA